jgi:glycerol-3-phosphate dehydrogenase
MKERNWLLWLAPHVVNPLLCLMPIYGHGLKGKEAMVAGLSMYNLIAEGFYSRSKIPVRLPKASTVNIDEALKLCPKIETMGLKGAAIWYEGFCQNTERLVLSFVKSSHPLGAVAANYTKAVNYRQYPDGSVVVFANDELSGQTIEIMAEKVINCTGPWFNNTLRLSEIPGKENSQNFAIGLNLITKPIIREQVAIAIRDSGRQDKRLFFIAPWRGLSIIGTEWFRFDEEIDQFKVEEEHCAALISKINEAYPAAELTINDVVFVHGGVVPCESRGRSSRATPDISKRYRLTDSSNFGHRRMVNIVGIKYTIAGDVAREVLQFVYPSTKFDRCQMRLIDGNYGDFETYKSKIFREWETRLDAQEIRRLLTNYGSEFNILMESIETGDVRNSSANISPAEILKAETLLAVRKEMALKLSDVVLRRTDHGTLGIPPDFILKKLANLMGEELGWSDTRIAGEIENVKQAYPAFLQTNS